MKEKHVKGVIYNNIANKLSTAEWVMLKCEGGILSFENLKKKTYTAVRMKDGQL